MTEVPNIELRLPDDTILRAVAADDETVYHDSHILHKTMHKYEECDFYSIEIDPETSEKSIHIWGYIYFSNFYENRPYRDLEYTGFIVPLKDFLKLNGDLERAVTQQYSPNRSILDITEEEAKKRLERYWFYHIFPNNDERPTPLPYEKITMDTPCGNYVNYTKVNTLP